MELDETGFMVGTGAACSARSDQPSHVLIAMGLSPESANQTIRVSLGEQTEVGDIHAFVDALARLVNR
jgi:cysteine desulfurase